MKTLNNAIAFLFAAAVFAMIGIEYGNQPHDNERLAHHCQNNQNLRQCHQ